MTKRTSKLTYALAVVFAAIVLLITSIVGGGANYARAATSAPSDVLEDLCKDRNFKIEDYPINDKDTKLHVMQVAESTDGELLVYVYLPCAVKYDLRASSINIARAKNDTINLSFPNYKLTYLNSVGVFYKYIVEGFTVSSDGVRYYNISNILRPHNNLLDGTLSSGNKESEAKNAVGKLFSAVTVNGNVQYNCIESEVIEIENKFVGYMSLLRGGKLDFSHFIPSVTQKATMRFFVAFSTDKPIDRLIEVEIQYQVRSLYYHVCSGSILCRSHGKGEIFGVRYGEPETIGPITIHADDEKDGSHKYGYGGRNFTWDKIQKTSDFLAEAERNGSDYILANNAAKEDFAKTQWLLNFYNASWEMKQDTAFDYHYDVNSSEASNVIILRLMFEANGSTYNLGAVDNKQTGSSSPAVVGKTDTVWDKIKDFFRSIINHINEIPWWVWVIVAVVALAIILPILSYFVPAVGIILKAIGKGLLTLLKGLWVVISAPFRLIAKLIANRKRKKTGKKK